MPVSVGIALIVAAVGILFAKAFAERSRAEFRVRLLELLAATVRRELPVAQAIAASVEALGRRRARALRVVLDQLSRGVPLGAALGRGAPRFFPPRVVAPIEAAKDARELAAALEGAAREELDSMAFAQRAQLAAIYPAILLLQAALVGLFLIRIFEPTAPGGASGALHIGVMGGYLSLVVGVLLIAVVYGVFLYRVSFAKIGPIAAVVERLALRLPGVGAILTLRVAERLARTLGANVRAGLPLGPALRRAGLATGVRHAAAAADAAATAVESGERPEIALGTLLVPGWVRARTVAAAASGNAERLASALDAVVLACARRLKVRGDALVELVYPAGIVVAAIVMGLQMRGLFVLVGAHAQAVRPW